MVFKHITAFLCCFTLLCIASARLLTEDPWTPVDWKTLPKAADDDKIQVWYLTAPLLEDDFGDILADLDLYHGAIAFINSNTNFSITINYDADDFFRASLFPKIKTYPNNTKYLDWYNQEKYMMVTTLTGAVFIYKDVNWTYWVGPSVKVSTISGALYNQFISTWNAAVNQSYPYYNMFAIMEKFGGKEYVEGWDCFDYVFAAFQYLHDNNATFNTTLKVKRNISAFYTGSNAPLDVTKLYYIDSSIHKAIVDFYSAIEVNLKDMTWWEFIVTIIDALKGQFFVRINEKYYQAQLSWPFIGIDWAYTALPGQFL